MHKLHQHKCSVISLNVRGLGDTVKRRSGGQFLFFTGNVSDEAVWRNEWGGEIYFSHGTSHSKGVCILINRAVKKK